MAANIEGQGVKNRKQRTRKLMLLNSNSNCAKFYFNKKSMIRKLKTINATLLTTSFLGYLEWEQNNHAFLGEAELQVIRQAVTTPSEILHPFIIIPLLGQVLLFYSLFKKQPGAGLSLIGMSCIGILMAFVFFIGIISRHWYTLISTLPFLFFAFLQLRMLRRK